MLFPVVINMPFSRLLEGGLRASLEYSLKVTIGSDVVIVMADI